MGIGRRAKGSGCHAAVRSGEVGADLPELLLVLLVPELAFDLFAVFEELVGDAFHIGRACQPDGGIGALGAGAAAGVAMQTLDQLWRRALRYSPVSVMRPGVMALAVISVPFKRRAMAQVSRRSQALDWA